MQCDDATTRRRCERRRRHHQDHGDNDGASGGRRFPGNGGAKLLGTVVNLTVKHGKATHKFEFGLDNTVEDLKLRLEGLTNVDRSMQKLMYKGALKEGTLAKNKVKNKAKLKLIGNPLDKVMSIVAATQNDANKETNDKIIGFEDELKKEKDEDGDSGPWKDMKEHKKVLDMGVPEGTGVGNKSLRLRLPSSPLLVRGMDGQPVRIVFQIPDYAHRKYGCNP